MPGLLLFFATFLLFVSLCFLNHKMQDIKKKKLKKINLINYEEYNKIDGFSYVQSPYKHLKIDDPIICNNIFSRDLLIPNNLHLGEIFVKWIGQCLGNITTLNPAWSKLKSIFRPLFFSYKNNFKNELLNDWKLHLDELYLKNKNDYKQVTIKEIINDLPVTYILNLIFGKQYVKLYYDEFNKLNIYAKKIMYKIFNKKDSLSVKNYQILQEFHKLWNDILENAKTNEYVKKEGLYIKIYKKYVTINKNKQVVTFEMFSHTLIEIIYANQDVVTPSLAWLIASYACNYHKFKSDKKGIFHFTEETGRLYPIIPESLPKELVTDYVTPDYTLKKGTVITIDFDNIGKSKRWGMDDLHKFNPERFQSESINHLIFISRYGYGGRKCPGRFLAIKLFAKILEILNEWYFVPSNPFKKNIKCYQKEALRMPKLNLWLVKKNDINYALDNNQMKFLKCPPTAMINEKHYMPISIGGKIPYMEQELCDKLIKFFVNKKINMVILLGDGIAHYNMQAFDKYSLEKAYDCANQIGNLLMNNFKKSIEMYGNNNISVCKWNDIGIPDLYDKLHKYPNLDNRVEAIAIEFIKYRGHGKINKSFKKKLLFAKRYIYAELPMLICGIKYKNEWIQLMYYSGTLLHLKKFSNGKNSLHQLAVDIITKDEYRNILSDILHNENLDKAKIPGFIGIDIEKL